MKFHQLPLIGLQRFFAGDGNALLEVLPLQAMIPDALNENGPVESSHDGGVLFLFNQTDEKKQPERTFDLEIATLKLRF